jgi:hypothetical protein
LKSPEQNFFQRDISLQNPFSQDEPVTHCWPVQTPPSGTRATHTPPLQIDSAVHSLVLALHVPPIGLGVEQTPWRQLLPLFMSHRRSTAIRPPNGSQACPGATVTSNWQI